MLTVQEQERSAGLKYGVRVHVGFALDGHLPCLDPRIEVLLDAAWCEIKNSDRPSRPTVAWVAVGVTPASTNSPQETGFGSVFQILGNSLDLAELQPENSTQRMHSVAQTKHKFD